MPEDLKTPFDDLFPRESDIFGIQYRPDFVAPEGCIICCGKCMKFLYK